MENRIAEHLPSENGQAVQAVAPGQQAVPWTGSKWQYAQVKGPADPAVFGKACAEWGANGWELCGMLPYQELIPAMSANGVLGQQAVQGLILMFKRPVQE